MRCGCASPLPEPLRQPACHLGVEFAANEAAGAGGRGAFDAIQQPFINIKRPVEPHRVVDGGDLHAGLKETNAVRLQRHRQEVKV